MPYRIVRFFEHEPRKVIDTGLTLEEVKEHCSDPEASSHTCESTEGQARTRRRGRWFDGWEEE